MSAKCIHCKRNTYNLLTLSVVCVWNDDERKVAKYHYAVSGMKIIIVVRPRKIGKQWTGKTLHCIILSIHSIVITEVILENKKSSKTFSHSLDYLLQLIFKHWKTAQNLQPSEEFLSGQLNLFEVLISDLVSLCLQVGSGLNRAFGNWLHLIWALKCRPCNQFSFTCGPR